MEMSDNKLNNQHRFQTVNKNSKGRLKGSRNRTKTITKEDHLKTIGDVYEDTMGNKKFGIALQAVTLQAKILGMLPTRKLSNHTSLNDVKEDKLRKLIEIMKKKSQS